MFFEITKLDQSVFAVIPESERSSAEDAFKAEVRYLLEEKVYHFNAPKSARSRTVWKMHGHIASAQRLFEYQFEQLFHEELLKRDRLAHRHLELITESAKLVVPKNKLWGHPLMPELLVYPTEAPKMMSVEIDVQRSNIKELEQKVSMLEHQLRCDRPYLQLYRLGASTLLVAVISIVFWLLTGVGVPFHPVFATVVAPVSVALIIMAFLTKPKKIDTKPTT